MTTTYTYDEMLVSDLHKDAYGHRPRESFWFLWKMADEAGKQVIWERLLRDLDHALEEQRINERRAVERFEERVANVRTLGLDEPRAIRAVLKAACRFAPEEDLAEYGWFALGLPFDSIRGLRAALEATR